MKTRSRTKKNTIIFANGTIDAYNQFPRPKFELVTPNEDAIRKATRVDVLGAAYSFRPAVQMMRKIWLKTGHSKEPGRMSKEIEKKAAEFVANTTVRSWLVAARLAEGYHDDFVAVLPPFYAQGRPCLKQLPMTFSRSPAWTS